LEELRQSKFNGATIGVIERDRHRGTIGVWHARHDVHERYYTTVFLQNVQLLPKGGERQVKRAIAAASVGILDNVVVSEYQRAARHAPRIPGEGQQQLFGRLLEQGAH
jgi:hypothetical protein